MSLGLTAPSLSAAEASWLALFSLALAIMLWPLGKRMMEAHRSRAHELRIALGQTEERK
jgi:hypothetical protein